MKQTFTAQSADVFKACKKVLKRLDIEIEQSSLSKGIINAKTSGSLLSWGEDIVIKIVQKAAKRTEVIVDSDASAQLFSWGKDSLNEKNILNELERELKK